MQKYFIFFLLFISIVVYPQNDKNTGGTEFNFLPSGLNVQPLKAHIPEARLGILYYTATSNLKVDIGNTIDLFEFIFAEQELKITLGIEFMAYAYSTSFEGKRLQIDAVDGLFGGNVSFSKKQTVNSYLKGKLRIIHNSAHLVDGHYDLANNQWIDNYKPIPYTKDFGELTLSNVRLFNDFILKYYGGISYATLVRPADLKRFNYFIGFELANSDLLGKIDSKQTNLFTAYQFLLDGTEKYSGISNVLAGIKFGNWFSKGIVFYLSYYRGQDVFNAYYNKVISKFGIGFNIDF